MGREGGWDNGMEWQGWRNQRQVRQDAVRTRSADPNVAVERGHDHGMLLCGCGGVDVQRGEGRS
jgi:hypothetical protein